MTAINLLRNVKVEIATFAITMNIMIFTEMQKMFIKWGDSHIWFCDNERDKLAAQKTCPFPKVSNNLLMK